MPEVHLAHMLLALEKGPREWLVAILPQSDMRWKTLSTNFAWDYVLQPHEGRELVELRIPARIFDQDHGDFVVKAETVMEGHAVASWTPSGDDLCSPPIASGTELYLRVEARPMNKDLPLSVPSSACARGGGHVHVKTAGGGGGP